MSGFLGTALLVCAIGLLEGALGPRGPRLQSLLALIAIAPLFAHLARGVAWRERLRVAAFAAALASAGLWYFSSGPAQYFALAAAFGLLTMAARQDRGVTKRFASSLALTVLLFATFVAVRDHLTLWPILGPLSARFSSAAASAFGVEARFGPTYSGAWVIAAMVCAFIARAAVVRRPRGWGVAAGILLLVLVPPGAIGLGRLVPVAARLHFPPALLRSQATLTLLLLIPLGAFLRGFPLSGERAGPDARDGRRDFVARRGGGARASRVGAAFLIIGLAMLAWSARVPGSPGRVLIDARGEFDLELPVWGAYGPDAGEGASISTLPPVLEAYGFSVTIRDTTLDAETLGDHDVLVVMNPADAFTPEEFEDIWSFVEQGGGLLVLGDHTNIHETMGPLNALLEPTGIRFRFDSAIPRVPRWTWYESIRFHPHPIVRGVRDETDIKVSVGASLRLPWSAMPLLTGTNAYSDAGNWENERGAYLGNMQYDPGERLGDVPLAAVARYGRGKCVVFGDTSPFQRIALVTSHEFVSRVFTYLRVPGDALPGGWVRAAGAILLAVGAALLVAGGLGAAPMIALSGVLAAALLLVIGSHGRVEPPPLGGPLPLARIDLAHGSRVDLHSGDDTSITGLGTHFTRAGYVALSLREIDRAALDSASVFTTIAPSIPFTNRERALLREFVGGGGLLIVATGYEEANGAAALLADFGYTIGPTPIGAAHRVVVQLPDQFIAMHESWPVLRQEGRGEVWASCWGFPLVMFERVGSGGIIVIGDSKFLCDVKLESRDAFVESNIDFMRAALEMAWDRIREERS